MDNENVPQGVAQPQSGQPIQPIEPQVPTQPASLAQSTSPVQSVSPAQPVSPESVSPVQSVEPQPMSPIGQTTQLQSVSADSTKAQSTPANSMESQPIQPIYSESSTPIQTQEPVAMGDTSNMDDSSKEQKKNSLLIWIIVAIIVLVMIGVVVAIFLLGNNGGGGNSVSFETVRNYCEKVGLNIDETISETEPKANVLFCQNPSSDYSTSVIFSSYEKPIMEYEEYNSISDIIMSYGEVLEKTDNYLKIYIPSANTIGVVSYVIIDGKNYLELKAPDNDTAKEALIAIGYADRSWPTAEQEMANNGGSSTNSNSSLQAQQRDTARRNDISRIDTSLVQYQTNNMGGLPEGPTYWKGTSEIECEMADVACTFVRNYMNFGDSSTTVTNEYVDPDGTPYSLYITENWVENGSISPTFGNANSYLVADGDGYKIGGNSPFMEHIIYVIPGGQCGKESAGVVKGDGERHFAVMIMLESEEPYCIDDQ